LKDSSAFFGERFFEAALDFFEDFGAEPLPLSPRLDVVLRELLASMACFLSSGSLARRF
jgi:hypothetical protein